MNRFFSNQNRFFSRFILLFLIMFSSELLLSQNVTIVHQSTANANYAVGKVNYLENKSDTSRGVYIATLQYRCPDHPAALIEVTSLLNIKTKSLNANSYYLHKFDRKDSTLTLQFKTYFIYKTAFDNNDIFEMKNNVYIFSFFKSNGEYQNCYVNDSLTYFASDKIFDVNCKANKKYQIKACNPSGFSKSSINFGFKIALAYKGPVKYKNKPYDRALFIGVFNQVYYNSNSTLNQPVNQFYNCGLQKVSYEEGRLIYEVYK